MRKEKKKKKKQNLSKDIKIIIHRIFNLALQLKHSSTTPKKMCATNCPRLLAWNASQNQMQNSIRKVISQRLINIHSVGDDNNNDEAVETKYSCDGDDDGDDVMTTAAVLD